MTDNRAARFLLPFAFGVAVIAIWEVIVRTFSIPIAILPAPSVIWEAIKGSGDILLVDWLQTVVRGALNGLWIGTAAGVVTAIAIDRFEFLRRGLLPVANFVAALPIVGVAPIMVMWFGFDWHSKAAVVTVMVFFPILVNTLAGLQDTDRMQRDLMLTYSANYWQTLGQTQITGSNAIHFQRVEDRCDAGADWRHRGGIFRITDTGNGISNIH